MFMVCWLLHSRQPRTKSLISKYIPVKKIQTKYLKRVKTPATLVILIFDPDESHKLKCIVLQITKARVIINGCHSCVSSFLIFDRFNH